MRAPLVETLRQLSEAAPLILVASTARQSEIAGLMAEGDMDFVARRGDFAGLAASLVERRLRWAERSETPLGAPWTSFLAETAEIFRHEINNPLTGILGNAELVLSHRDRLPPARTAFADGGRPCGTVARNHANAEQRVRGRPDSVKDRACMAGANISLKNYCN